MDSIRPDWKRCPAPVREQVIDRRVQRLAVSIGHDVQVALVEDELSPPTVRSAAIHEDSAVTTGSVEPARARVTRPLSSPSSIGLGQGGKGAPNCIEVSDSTPKNLANFIWQVADILRGDYTPGACHTCGQKTELPEPAPT